MEFPRQEDWSGLPCPPPGHCPDPGIELTSPALAGGFLTTEPPRKPVPLSPVTDKGTSGSPALAQSRRSSVVLPEHGVQVSLRGLERTELCRIQTHVVNMNIFKAKCVVPYNLFSFVFLGSFRTVSPLAKNIFFPFYMPNPASNKLYPETPLLSLIALFLKLAFSFFLMMVFSL